MRSFLIFIPAPANAGRIFLRSSKPVPAPPHRAVVFFPEIEPVFFFLNLSAPSPKVALSDSAAAALAAWRGGSTPAAGGGGGGGGGGSAASGSKKKLSAAQGNNLTKYWGTPLSSQKPLHASGKGEARGGGSGSFGGGGGGRGDYVGANGGSGSGAASVPEVSREEAFDPMCESQDIYVWTVLEVYVYGGTFGGGARVIFLG